MTRMELLTTAWVVVLPTPAVPPLVRKPTWHPVIDIMKPKTMGLTSVPTKSEN